MKHLLIALLITFSVYSQKTTQNLLFLGNSLTYSNGLPQMLEELAKDLGKTLKTTAVCYPNYALEDHWNDGKFQTMLSKQNFDYVIVQQGPSSQPAGKEMLVTYGAKIKAICETYNAKLVYFTVWPSKQYDFTFDAVIANHRYAAKVNNAMVFPVGEIWKSYNEDENLEHLYTYDNFHPSAVGSFLAALTMLHDVYPEKNLHELNFTTYKKWCMITPLLKPC